MPRVLDSNEDQALFVVCASKAIRTAAIGEVVWSMINLFIGYRAVQVNILNTGILGLAVVSRPNGSASEDFVAQAGFLNMD